MRAWVVLLVACGTSGEPSREAAPQDSGTEQVLARCDYINPFSQGEECKEYLGAGWTEETWEADCAAPVPGGQPGTLRLGEPCGRADLLGECRIDQGMPLENVLVFTGTDASVCGGLELGCTFAGGELELAGLCLGAEGGGVTGPGVFQPFEQVCRDPLAGEPPGQSADGQVCTWQAISGATEAGRRYVDYASCEPVLTQRPYWPYPVEVEEDPDDPRLSDEAWLDEAAWVTAEVEATACVCCHTSAEAPSGPSGWYLEAGPLWIDTVDDDGLAMLAGWVDSTAFGAFPAQDNNGFDRSTTGLPTSDVPRMVAFLEGELARRGLDPSDFAETPPFGGPLYDQLFYEPGPCADGVGLIGDRVEWEGGGARYVYVLEADANSPGVPPNLDTPPGTLWRVDVAPTDPPLASGIPYGAVSGAVQRVPATGSPPALVSGSSYYLVALADVYQPLTRCLFQAP